MHSSLFSSPGSSLSMSAGVAASRIDVTDEGVLGVLLDVETANVVAEFRLIGANHDEAVRLIGGECCEELLGLVFGDAAVDVEGHCVLTVLEAVLLYVNGVAVDDVADACVAPQFEAAAVDVGMEDPVEQLVGCTGVALVDDVPLERAHVVAEVQHLVGVNCVVFDTGGVLARNTARTDEQSCVSDEQVAQSLIVRAQVDGEFGGGHACSSGW